MAAYAAAFVIRNALVKFAAVDYSNQCSKARLVPDVNVQTMRTLVPDGQITDVDSAVWTLELSGVQDHETGGLSAFLQTNQGTLQTVIIAPVAGTGKKQATVSVRIIPGPFGGDQGSWATLDLSMPVQGQPTFAAQP
jgi:xanthine dehydrogenase molybdopterin-binding subunit B